MRRDRAACIGLRQYRLRGDGRLSQEDRTVAVCAADCPCDLGAGDSRFLPLPYSVLGFVGPGAPRAHKFSMSIRGCAAVVEKRFGSQGAGCVAQLDMRTSCHSVLALRCFRWLEKHRTPPEPCADVVRRLTTMFSLDGRRDSRLWRCFWPVLALRAPRWPPTRSSQRGP